jgi:putative membrane protein
MRAILRRLPVACALVVASWPTGCVTDSSLREVETGDHVERTELNDAQVAGILLAMHEQRIAQAKAAMPRLSDPAVQAYAREMMQDHAASNEELRLLLEASGIAPEESMLGVDMAHAAEDVTSLVDGSAESTIDREYIDGQAAMHAYVIRTINDRLLPPTQSPQLRKALESTLARLRTQLEAAQQLQERMVERTRSASLDP